MGGRRTDGWWRRLGALRLDVTPLRRYRDYRLLFGAATISLFGTFFTMVAAPLQLKQLTGSYLAVGLVGVAEFVPILVFGLWGGALADAFDRRCVVIVTESIQLTASVALVGNAVLDHPHVWVIYAAAGLAAGGVSVQRPSMDALMPRLVGYEHQLAASALVGLQHNGGAVLAPAIGGVLAAWNLPVAYGVDVATFVVSLGMLLAIRPVRISEDAEPVSVAGIVAGVRYAVSRRVLLGTYVVDVVAMSFAMPEAVFPFLADELHAPGALGLLYSAGAVGGVLATVTSGWTARVHRHGLAILVAATGWGAAMALAGVAPGLWLVLCCLALAGAADMASGVFRGTIWNQTIPDHLRGRLAGIELLSYASGPSLGNARAGLMARLGGVRFSIGFGGVLCMAGVAVCAALLPDFVHYDSRTDQHAVAERTRRAAAALAAEGTAGFEQAP